MERHSRLMWLFHVRMVFYNIMPWLFYVRMVFYNIMLWLFHAKMVIYYMKMVVYYRKMVLYYMEMVLFMWRWWFIMWRMCFFFFIRKRCFFMLWCFLMKTWSLRTPVIFEYWVYHLHSRNFESKIKSWCNQNPFGTQLLVPLFF